MTRLKSLMIYTATEFGPLVAFFVLSFAFGLKAAIAGALAIIAVEGVWRWRRGQPFTRVYFVVSGLTIVFGLFDLVSKTPFLIQYEAVITNVVTGFAFVQGARGPKPMLQEIAEQRRGEAFPVGEDIRRFFQIFTWIWAAYFFAKAMLYFMLASIAPMGQVIALRSLIGGVSLGLMVWISSTQGRRMFLLFQRMGWLPKRDSEMARP